MIRDAIATVVEGNSLTFEEAREVMDEMMTGQATFSQVGAFLTAIRVKGETVDEIAGMASVMREKALRVMLPCTAIDIVGTGGDGTGSLNISTAASFVAAGAGLRVAKHGNRAASSQCGSADVLETLGAKIELSPESVQRCIEEAGIGFMFAPMYHPSMKYVASTRKEIGIRTIFNYLGPLCNPANVPHLLLGVPSEQIGEKIAAVLHRLGTTHSMVVYGTDGFDELSISAPSLLWEVSKGFVKSPCQVTPDEFSCHIYPKEAVRGGNAKYNAKAIRLLLDGERGPFREVVIMNAAAALMIAGKTNDMKTASAIATESIDSGRAKQTLEKYIELTNRLS